MTIRTALCDMLGIKYPIMLAGMGGVSYAELAAAVSNAGGFGTLGMAGRSPDEIKTEIKKVRQAWTDKKPVEWVRIHYLARHAHFPHMRHIKALGPNACTTCHGERGQGERQDVPQDRRRLARDPHR